MYQGYILVHTAQIKKIPTYFINLITIGKSWLQDYMLLNFEILIIIKELFESKKLKQMNYFLCGSQLYPCVYSPQQIFYSCQFSPNALFGVANFSFYLNQNNIPAFSLQKQEATIDPRDSIPITVEQPKNVVSLEKQSKQRNLQQKMQNDITNIQNRNILPNNLNLILSYVRRVNKSGKVVRNIIAKYDQLNYYNYKSFYSYQIYLKEKIPNHKNRQTLKELINFQDQQCRIFSLEEQRFYNKVCRTLIYSFLREQFHLTLLNSTKIQRTNKIDHLKIRRYLKQNIQPESSMPKAQRRLPKQ